MLVRMFRTLTCLADLKSIACMSRWSVQYSSAPRTLNALSQRKWEPASAFHVRWLRNRRGRVPKLPRNLREPAVESNGLSAPNVVHCYPLANVPRLHELKVGTWRSQPELWKMVCISRCVHDEFGSWSLRLIFKAAMKPTLLLVNATATDLLRPFQPPNLPTRY